ncbi:MAG: type II toxin-antitoxin system VapC family toxin [candidate division NC10 bacterium]|nr:type II toxin-antitoxin system VapC family toxin [candidate division NC10 bacterium]
MNLYAESSAVLAWLLGDAGGEPVRKALSAAEIVLASHLTLIECSRILIRAGTTGRLSEAQVAGREARLRRAEAHWTLLEIDPEIIERARRPFPLEPIRTLDALHLASALVARLAVPGIALLSLDDQVRRCARQLGFELLPA